MRGSRPSPDPDDSRPMPDPATPITVCYNGACPVCRAEIDHYRGQADPASGLAWLDAAGDPATAARHGLTGEDPFRRLHAVTADGRVLAGMEAFAAVWDRLPRYRWLARLVRRPVVRPVADVLYERVAAPVLFAMHRRRERRRGLKSRA